MPILPVTRSNDISRNKRRGAIQPSSADVEVISPRVARDPGVRTTQEAFESAGVSVGGLAPGLDALEKAALRQQTREDIVSRSEGINQYTESVGNELMRLNTEDDLSHTDVLQGYGKFLADKKQEILDSHTGSADSYSMLAAKLNDIEATYTGTASGESVKIGKGKVDKVLNSRIAPLVASVSQDPSVKNVYSAWMKVDESMDDLKGAYSPEDENSKIINAKENITLAALDKRIINGRVEEAEALLDNPDILGSLTSETQRDVRRRIETVYKARTDIAMEVQKAFAVERAKLAAKRENINIILNSAGAYPMVDSPAIITPFGEGVAASGDAQDAARLFSASRRLLLAGEATEANALLSQARFIIDNSPEIKRQQELDKPISEDLASEFGVPVGTPLRSVMDIIPRSPEEQAESRSIATARGKQKIGGEEQIAFIDEARTMVSDLMEEIKIDPTIVGIGGSLRATGQTAIGVISDLGGGSLVDSARELAFENTDMGLDEITQLFDSPTLSVLSILENSVGLILARLRTPEGRIPVDVIERSIDDVSLTGLKGSEQVGNRLNFVLQQLDRRSHAIEKRFGMQPSSTGTSIGIPRFMIENGELVPVQGGQ